MGMEGVEFIDDGLPPPTADLSLRSSWDIIPNPNDPADVPPATVGPPEARPGEVGALEVTTVPPGPPPPTPRSMPWSGWPAPWRTPHWHDRLNELTDAAWMCLDLNASILSTMPPYESRAGQLLAPATWMTNPDPDIYTSWEEFAKQLFWDYQMGEVFILCTARFADGWPARFRVVEPWLVNAEMIDGRRRYTIGTIDPGPDLLHIRYKSTTSDARGHGPLESGRNRLIAASVLSRYATTLAEGGGVPYYVIKHPLELDKTQADDLRQEWWQSRMTNLGMPAVLSGGIEIEQLQLSPSDMALLDLSQFNEARIAVLLGVPPFLVGLPSGGDPMTYSNSTALFDYHWRAGLRPKARHVMTAMSAWLLPRGTDAELNRDEYVRPDPYTRAMMWEILVRIGVVTAEQVAVIERYAVTGTAPDAVLAAGGAP